MGYFSSIFHSHTSFPKDFKVFNVWTLAYEVMYQSTHHAPFSHVVHTFFFYCGSSDP